MACSVAQPEKVMWEENVEDVEVEEDVEVDSSDDEYEDDHSIYVESLRHSQWFCEGCNTCITKPCHVDTNNQHFQLNKQTGQYFPTSISMNGKTAHLIIHRFKETEIFGYLIE